MEKNHHHHPEKSFSFRKGIDDDDETNSAADGTTLPTTTESSSPKCSNEATAATETTTTTTEGDMEKNLHQPDENITKPETDEIEKPDQEDNEKKETEEKGEEEGGGGGGEEQGEEKTTDPDPQPEIEYTLETASEDIDRFLSNLSSVPKQDKEGDTDDHNEEEQDKEHVPVVTGVEIPGCLEKYLDFVEEEFSKHETPESKLKGYQPTEDDATYLKSVERISKLYSNLSGVFKLDSDKGPLINRIGRIQQRVMSYIEDEFRNLLEDSKVVIEPDHQKQDQASSDHCELPQSGDQSNPNPENDFPGYPSEVLTLLNKIAKEMISGGFESECCEVYLITRRNVIEESLKQIGFEKISIDEVHKMHWESLEREIPSWIKAFKQCARVYFPGERKLVETIFPDFPSLSDSLFSNLTRGVVIQLLNFAEAVAISKRSQEKLFKFLDIYETLRDDLPAIDSLFPEECAKELRAETTTARCRIGETAICIFCDLENSIKSDTSKTPVPGGAVHPLTRYTMNYLKLTCEYKDTVEQVFKDHSKIERADSTSRPRNYEGGGGDSQNYNNDENQSPFAAQLMRVMGLLDANLEAKSKLYKDISLSCIFMMNNGRYMLQKIKGSAEIHQVMGDTWCRKRSSDLRNYHKNYQRETWTKLLGCLNHEGLMVNGKVVKPVLKERFKSFNAMFEEIHKTQGSWVVSDEQLQSELRVSISAVVIPAYRSFMGRFSQYLDPGRQTEKYIKFQSEDIETYIDELFDGNPTSMARRR